MNQVEDFTSRSKKRKWEEGKSPFLKGFYAEFSDLPPHLPGLGTGIELCWLAPPMAGLPPFKEVWKQLCVEPASNLDTV